jgi:TonB family protein
VTSLPEEEARKEATAEKELSKPGTAAGPKDTQGASGAAVERADSDLPKADKIAATVARERVAPADDAPAEIKVPAGQSQANAPVPADINALSEVVVTGYDNSKKGEGDQPEEPIQFAEPVGGKSAYSKYLDNNLHYPPAALEQKIEGTVTLEFTVQPNGALEDFTVIRGLEGGCNEEVIRLVKEGPAWSPSLRGVVPLKGTVRVRVKFNLPK